MEEGERNPAEFSDTHLSQGAEELEMCVCVWEREIEQRERDENQLDINDKSLFKYFQIFQFTSVGQEQERESSITN